MKKAQTKNSSKGRIILYVRDRDTNIPITKWSPELMKSVTEGLEEHLNRFFSKEYKKQIVGYEKKEEDLHIYLSIGSKAF